MRPATLAQDFGQNGHKAKVRERERKRKGKGKRERERHEECQLGSGAPCRFGSSAPCRFDPELKMPIWLKCALTIQEMKDMYQRSKVLECIMSKMNASLAQVHPAILAQAGPANLAQDFGQNGHKAKKREREKREQEKERERERDKRYYIQNASWVLHTECLLSQTYKACLMGLTY